MMIPLDLLQWPGMAFGLLGAPLVSGRSDRARRWGFVSWIVSNVCWIAWGVHTGGWGLVAMQAVFCATSFQGWWNNRSGMPDSATGDNRASAKLAPCSDASPS